MLRSESAHRRLYNKSMWKGEGGVESSGKRFQVWVFQVQGSRSMALTAALFRVGTSEFRCRPHHPRTRIDLAPKLSYFEEGLGYVLQNVP